MDASRTTNNNLMSPRVAHDNATAPAAAPEIEQGNSSLRPIFYNQSPSGFLAFQSRNNAARVSFGPATLPAAPVANDPAAAAAASLETNCLSQPAFVYDKGDMVETAVQAEQAAAAAAATTTTPTSAPAANTQTATTPAAYETITGVRAHLRDALASRDAPNPATAPPAAGAAATEQQTLQVPPLLTLQQQQLAPQQQHAIQQQALQAQKAKLLVMQ